MTPFYMLKGRIEVVKEVKGMHEYVGHIERYYRDEYGKKAVVVMRDLKGRKI